MADVLGNCHPGVADSDELVADVVDVDELLGVIHSKVLPIFMHLLHLQLLQPLLLLQLPLPLKLFNPKIQRLLLVPEHLQRAHHPSDVLLMLPLYLLPHAMIPVFLCLLNACLILIVEVDLFVGFLYLAFLNRKRAYKIMWLFEWLGHVDHLGLIFFLFLEVLVVQHVDRLLVDDVDFLGVVVAYMPAVCLELFQLLEGVVGFSLQSDKRLLKDLLGN